MTTNIQPTKLLVERQTLTYVDSYWVIHISNVDDLNVHDFMKVLINIMRQAQYHEDSIWDAIEESTLEF